MSAFDGCVFSLRESLSLLGTSIHLLDSGVADLPRLSNVLHTTRHFELIPESTLLTAQASLRDEIAPEINALLARVDAHLDRLERREEALRAKFELLQGRLDRGTDGSRLAQAGSAAPARKSGAAEAGTPSMADLMRMKALRQKRERLTLTIDRLQLQAQQRERQLRKSMAVPQDLDVDF